MAAPPAQRVSPAGLRVFLPAVGCAAGVVLGTVGPRGAPSVLPGLLALALLAGRGRSRPTHLLAALLLGCVAARVRPLMDGSTDLMARLGEPGGGSSAPIALRARLVDAEVLPEERVALELDLERYALPGEPEPTRRPRRPVRLRLTLPLPVDGRGPAWRPGDLLDLPARIGPPRSFANPGAFDYGASLRARGIGLVGTIKSSRLVTPVPHGRRPVAGFFPRLRHALVERLRSAAGEGHPDTAAFLAALLVGEREELPGPLQEALLRAGVFHIVALSGLNVGLVALLASGSSRLIPAGQRGRRALTAAAVALYWALAREGGSITRAALMALLHLAGGGLQRRVPALATLSVAAMLLLTSNPASCFDIGFQLSFGATLAIVLLGSRPRPPRRPAPSTARRGALWLLASLRTSLAALAGTTLCTAFHFQTMTPAALAANLFAVPIASMLLALAFPIVLLEPLLPAVATLLSGVATCAIGLLGWLSQLVSAPALLSFHVLPPQAVVALWGSAAPAAASISRGPGRRRAVLLLLTVAFVWTAVRGRGGIAAGDLGIAVLDVGQGDAILVRLPAGTTLLVDAGGFSRSGFDVGARVVAPALRALGLLRLDVLAVTHAHRDHLGGAASILRQFHPRALWLGRMPAGDPAIQAIEDLAEALRIPIVFPRRGVWLDLGGARIDVVNPGRGVPERPRAANDDSLVLRVSAGCAAALLTGDLEGPLESILIEERREIGAGLLKVGHHGSRTSTTPSFLDRVAPRTAVISVGASNPWGHPDPEVIERLEFAGAEVYRTDRDGAVLFRADGGAWRAVRLTGGDAAGEPGLR